MVESQSRSRAEPGRDGIRGSSRRSRDIPGARVRLNAQVGIMCPSLPAYNTCILSEEPRQAFPLLRAQHDQHLLLPEFV